MYNRKKVTNRHNYYNVIKKKLKNDKERNKFANSYNVKKT